MVPSHRLFNRELSKDASRGAQHVFKEALQAEQVTEKIMARNANIDLLNNVGQEAQIKALRIKADRAIKTSIRIKSHTDPNPVLTTEYPDGEQDFWDPELENEHLDAVGIEGISEVAVYGSVHDDYSPATTGRTRNEDAGFDNARYLEGAQQCSVVGSGDQTKSRPDSLLDPPETDYFGGHGGFRGCTLKDNDSDLSLSDIVKHFNGSPDRYSDQEAITGMCGDTISPVIGDLLSLLQQGPDEGLRFVFEEIARLTVDGFQEPLRALVTALCNEAFAWNHDVQVDAGRTLILVLDLAMDSEAVYTIITTSLRILDGLLIGTAIRRIRLFTAWSEVLTKALRQEEFKAGMFENLIEIADLWMQEESNLPKIVSVRIIGAIGGQLRAQDDAIADFISRNKLYLEIRDNRIRMLAVQNLANLSVHLPMQVVADTILPSFKKKAEELRNSQEYPAYIAALVKLFEKNIADSSFPRPLRRFVLQEFTLFSRKIKRTISEQNADLTADDESFLKSASDTLISTALPVHKLTLRGLSCRDFENYRDVCTSRSASVRLHCARGLPTMSMVFGRKYGVQLLKILINMSHDDDLSVRATLARLLHRIAKELKGRVSFDGILLCAVSLLRDSDSSVYLLMIENFSALLSTHASDSVLKRVNSPLGECLSITRSRAKDSEWRVQKQVAKSIGCCAPYLHPELLDYALKTLFGMATETRQNCVRVRNFRVRRAAMCAVVRVIRRIPGIEERDDAVEKYWASAKNGDYQLRICMIYAASVAVRIFSRTLFSQLFAEDVLMLSRDPVSNVRLRLASVLTLFEPAASGTKALKNAVARLRRDKDPDIIEWIQFYDDYLIATLRERDDGISSDEDLREREIRFYRESNKSIYEG